MKKIKKLLVIFPVIAVLAVIFLTPAVATAKSPFTQFGSLGTITGIGEGTVAPAGNSGRYIVKDRFVTGALIEGSGPQGGFTLTYGANVPIETQSGQIHGTLTIDTAAGEVYEAKVRGESSLGLTPVPCTQPDWVTCIGTPYGNFVPGLLIEGTFTFTSGAKGNGDLSAWLVPLLDADYHIIDVIISEVTINGKWNQAS